MKRIQKLYFFLLILLSIATLSVLLFAEKSASQDGEKKTGEDSAQSGNATDGSEAASPIAELPIWQLYENKEGKFHFDCPGDWKIKEDKDEYGNTVVTLSSPETIEAVRKEAQAPGQDQARAEADVVVTYSVSVANQKVNRANGYKVTTLSELIKRDTTIKKLGDTESNGTKMTEVIMSGEGETYGIFIEKDSRLYEISFVNRADKASLSAGEKNILETFEVE